jgi:hypothetical protein
MKIANYRIIGTLNIKKNKIITLGKLTELYLKNKKNKKNIITYMEKINNIKIVYRDKLIKKKFIKTIENIDNLNLEISKRIKNKINIFLKIKYLKIEMLKILIYTAYGTITNIKKVSNKEKLNIIKFEKLLKDEIYSYCEESKKVKELFNY